MRTLSDLGSLQGKNVLIRCDLNVPLQDGTITDDGRVRAALTTIRELISEGARVIAMSHLGRPKGQIDEKYSLAPVATRMSELLGQKVQLVDQSAALKTAGALEDGQVVLLENLRFSAGETSKDAGERLEFARSLAALGDVYVSDGFGVVHRNQASVTDVPQLLPSAAGRLIEKELTVLNRLTHDPARPYTVVLGGSKVSDKLGVISNLLEQVDSLLIGGGMAFTFLAAQNKDVAGSLVERDQLETVQDYLTRAAELGVKIIVPTDVVVAEAFDVQARHEIVEADQIGDTEFGKNAMGLDIGPKTAKYFAEVIAASQTVFWNGPMGVFEMKAFANGTREIAQALTECEGLTVVGGGDSAAAVRTLNFEDEAFGHISTGGGASLEFLEGKTLPGLEVLA